MHLSELKAKSPADLLAFAESLQIENASSLRKQDMMFAILKQLAENEQAIHGDGTLEILPDGFGFLRSPQSNYLPGPDDIYVSPAQVRRFGLRIGDTVEGQIRAPKDGERYFALLKVNTVNFEPPEALRHRINFDNLTPLYPTRRDAGFSRQRNRTRRRWREPWVELSFLLNGPSPWNRFVRSRNCGRTQRGPGTFLLSLCTMFFGCLKVSQCLFFSFGLLVHTRPVGSRAIAETLGIITTRRVGIESPIGKNIRLAGKDFDVTGTPFFGFNFGTEAGTRLAYTHDRTTPRTTPTTDTKRELKRTLGPAAAT
jgi:hypothetical protein